MTTEKRKRITERQKLCALCAHCTGANRLVELNIQNTISISKQRREMADVAANIIWLFSSSSYAHTYHLINEVFRFCTFFICFSFYVFRCIFDANE